MSETTVATATLYLTDPDSGVQYPLPDVSRVGGVGFMDDVETRMREDKHAAWKQALAETLAALGGDQNLREKVALRAWEDWRAEAKVRPTSAEAVAWLASLSGKAWLYWRAMREQHAGLTEARVRVMLGNRMIADRAEAMAQAQGVANGE